MNGTELAGIIAVVVLVASAAFLAMAETSLTHLPRAKVLALEEERRRGAAALSRLVERRQEMLNPVLLLVLVCHLTAATIVGLLAQSYLGPGGLAAAVVVEVVVIFVLAEAAPKTYALEHTERAALIAAPAVALLARFTPT
jgi:Mg2+/Co2+ transporter CorB